MTIPGDPLSRPLIEIARDLRKARVSARDAVEAAITRHERFGERLRAYSFWAPDQARAVAAAADAAFSAGVSTGPLQGPPGASSYSVSTDSCQPIPSRAWFRRRLEPVSCLFRTG